MHVVVVMMGGARIVYEEGSEFHTEPGWLYVHGKTEENVAAFPEHRVSRVYRSSTDGDNKGVGVTQAVGL